MLFALLTSSPDDASGGGCFSKENLPSTLLFIGIVAIFIIWMYFSNKKRMKQQQEYIDRRNSIKPGNKVMTIGGITGTVVEVNPDDNTFVLETGSDELGKSYLRFDKAAIHDTDAVVEQPVEQPVEEIAETPVEEVTDEQADELFDEANKPETKKTEKVEETVKSVEETTEEDTVDEE
ncbi:MAG: preprotein translocase subunit YajC [Clostridia bacterium]|nr:preprotein translocase subunit YajC [Clostridia bacterium]